jgi:hypothetical protein
MKAWFKEVVARDKCGRLESGIAAPLIFVSGVLLTPTIAKLEAWGAFGVCVVVTGISVFVARILKRTLLRTQSSERLALLGLIGWIAAVPLVFVATKLFCFVRQPNRPPEPGRFLRGS